MAKNRLFLSLILITSLSDLYGQVNRYVVFFKDKANTTYSINQPEAFLSARAIARRQKNGVATTEQDFPVNRNYVNSVAEAGANVHYTSRWFNAALVQCNAQLVPALEALSPVARVEYVAPGQLTNARSLSSYLSARLSSSNSVRTATQINMLGLDAMHALNHRGEGVKVAVFDSGFPGVNTTAPFATMKNNIADTYNFVNKQSDVYKNDDHGTEVLSVMAAFIQGSFTGGAYKADYHLYLTEDVGTEFRVEEYNWLFAAERADSAGVDVINASLGYNTFDNASMNYTKSQLDGKTAVVTRAAQLAADRGIVVVVSAGNEGSSSWQLVTPPADAAGVIAVGSVTSLQVRSTFSSMGPTSDSRIKPDLSAMGSGTFVVRNTGNTGTSSGTSVAAPLLASLVAGIIQRYDTLTKDEVIAVLKATASQAQNPDMLLGYGIPDFNEVRQRLELTTGIEDAAREATFAVYPNPADTGFVFIESLKPLYQLPLQIEVWDAKGALLKQVDPSALSTENRIKLELASFPAGLLHIRIKQASGTDIFKVVNQR